MTDAPPTRKTHVIRIFGTNQNGDVLSNIWLDIERIDLAKSTTQTGEANWQGLQRKFRWVDDPNSEDGDGGNPARKTNKIKVCAHDQDPTNPDQWVEVEVTQYMKCRHSDQGQQDKYLTDPNADFTSSRIFQVRRIKHQDTSIDNDAQAAAANGQKVYVVSGDQYQLNGNKDDNQYIDHEVITYLKPIDTNNQNVPGQGMGQGQQVKLLNQYLIDQSDDPISSDGSTDTPGANGFDPPWRLDPYQNIVNCQFQTFYPVDCIFYGYGDSFAHLQLGVNSDGAPYVVDTGSYFGDGYQFSKNQGPDDAQPVPEPIGETILSGPDLATGNFPISNHPYFTSLTSGVGPSLTEDVDLTSGKGLAYFTARGTDIGTVLGTAANNSDNVTFSVTGSLESGQTVVLTDAKGNTIKTIALQKKVTQILTHTGDNTGLGQGRQSSFISDGKGKSFFVVTDFSTPHGEGEVAYDDPLPDNSFNKSVEGYQNQQDFFVRVFDTNGNEALTIPWGTTTGQSESVGGRNNAAVTVITAGVLSFPTDTITVFHNS